MRVVPGEENLVRRLPSADPDRAATGLRIDFDRLRAYAGPPVVEIVVEGLPNLWHEIGHVVLSACLDDDHGIDYQAIPFDLQSEAGRAVLFEELACCVLSCAYAARPRDGETPERTAARVDAWFVEQVEIQPVFYGLEASNDEFWARVDDLVQEHASAFEAVLERAYDRVAMLLRWVGAEPELAVPPRRLTYEHLRSRAARAKQAG